MQSVQYFTQSHPFLQIYTKALELFVTVSTSTSVLITVAGWALHFHQNQNRRDT